MARTTLVPGAMTNLTRRLDVMQDNAVHDHDHDHDHGRRWRELIRAEDVTDSMLVAVANCVEDYFDPEDGPMATEDFIDRFCEGYLVATDPISGALWEIGGYDTPAARKILRHARSVRREMA